MNGIDSLLLLTEAYCATTGLAETTVSRMFFGRGGRLAQIVAGGDVGTRTVASIVAKFSAEWPADAPWPDGVERPAIAPPEPLSNGPLPDGRGERVARAAE